MTDVLRHKKCRETKSFSWHRQHPDLCSTVSFAKRFEYRTIWLLSDVFIGCHLPGIKCCYQETLSLVRITDVSFG